MARVLDVPTVLTVQVPKESMTLPDPRRRILRKLFDGTSPGLRTSGVVCLQISTLISMWVSTQSAEASLIPFSKLKISPFHTELEPEKIRVRVSEGLAAPKIRGLDLQLYSGTDASGHRALASSDRLSEWQFHCAGGGVQAKNSTSHQLIRVQGPLSLESPAGFLSLGQRPYRETLIIHPNGSSCEIVNRVDIEKYLDGLVNAEFSSKWSEEAVAAQVIAARTYAYHQIQAMRGPKSARAAGQKASHFDVDSTTRDQVYDGSYREDYRASRSVSRTRGVILKASFNSNLPIKAFYHSTCGGQTELPSQVWGGSHAGFKRSVKCPYCAQSPKAHWELDYKPAEITMLLFQGLKAQGARPFLPRGSTLPIDWISFLSQGSLSRFQVHSLDTSGRANQIAASWKWENRTLDLILPAVKVRDWFGATQMKSTAIQITPEYRAHSGSDLNQVVNFRIAGKGFGHGVGLCQWGAKTMGEQGFKTSDILKLYYPDAILGKAW
ncbi:MAG: SpoIID/LytB domain-containing protein [Methylotenera sp.]|nr:SpoIID/LytB domain-containing protein [Oligoflexia bacterium]